MEWLFPWLLLLHVLGAIIAFGPTFAFPIIGAMGGAEPQHANFATRVSYAVSTRLVTPVALSMAVTGAGMILVAGIDLSSRAYWWLGIAIVLYVGAIGFSLSVQSRNVRRIVELTSAPRPPDAGGPPPELLDTIKRVQRGGMALSVIVIVIASLMVLKPQF